MSPGEVAEAARRFEEAKAKRGRGEKSGKSNKSNLVAEFQECSTLGIGPFSAEPPTMPNEQPRGENGGGGGGGEDDKKASKKKRERESSGNGNGGGDGEGGGEGRRRKTTRRRPRRRFDSVSCMFAAHYFCSSDAALSVFLENVSRNLRPVRCRCCCCCCCCFCWWWFLLFSLSSLKTKKLLKKLFSGRLLLRDRPLR